MPERAERNEADSEIFDFELLQQQLELSDCYDLLWKVYILHEHKDIFISRNFSLNKSDEWSMPEDFLSEDEREELAKSKIKFYKNTGKILYRYIIYYDKEEKLQIKQARDFYYPKVSGLIESFTWYSTACDNGSWVEDLYIQLEEERIADEILSMDNQSQRFRYENLDVLKSENSNNQNEIVEEFYYNENRGISHLKFGDEIFILEKLPDTGKSYFPVMTATHGDKESIQRFYYDNQFRTVKKEYWNSSATFMKRVDSYNFSGLNKKPYGKTIEEYTTEKSGDENKTILSSKNEMIYGNNGQVSVEKKYELIEYEKLVTTSKNKLKSEKDKKLVQTLENSWLYDKQDRLIQAVKTEFNYDEKSGDLVYKFGKKYSYKYNEDDNIPPDQEYYEENILRMKLKYGKSKSDYVQQYFFDDDFTVISYYENDKIKKEVFMVEDFILRTKTYDNEVNE